MKELVQFLARQLVNDPDAVEVKETHGDTASSSNCAWQRKISDA